MNIFITGLCLQGNKGGPAIALSLMQQIRKYLPESDFVFSVPSGEEFQHELLWSRKYKVEVVERYSIKDVLPPYVFKNFHLKYIRVKTWFKKLSVADLVIEMSAISYVGHPIGNVRSALLGARFMYFLSALIFKKPFLAWTQSYGPLSPKILRFIAKLDLKRQPVIFCRGDDCLSEVNRLLPQKKVFSFPDVAVIFEYNQSWGTDYLYSIYQDINFEKLITISPSAVMYKRTKKHTGENKHIEDIVNLCRYLFEKGFFILLVPHTFRLNRHYPEICDFAVSQLVLNHFKDIPNVGLIQEDLSPAELKSIISTSCVHIGARYHSIVASLSSDVPAISLSWHPKYKDIMREFGSENYIFDGIHNKSIYDLFDIFDEVYQKRPAICKKLVFANEKARAKIEENTKLFVNLMKGSLHDL